MSVADLSAPSEAVFDLFEHAPVPICLVSEGGEILQANSAFRDAFPRLRSPHLAGLVGDSVLANLLAGIQREVRGERNDPVLFRLATDGVTRRYQINLGRAPNGVLLTWTDVTTLRTRADQLREGAKRRQEAFEAADREREIEKTLLDSVFANAPVGLAFFDRDYCFVRVNDHLTEMNGISASEHIGRPVRDVVPVNAVEVEPILEQVFRTAIPHINVEIRGETAAQPGVERHWLTSFFPIRMGNEVRFVGAVVSEITDRKRAELALRRSEERLRLAVEAGEIGLWDWDIAEQSIAWNERTYRLHGMPLGSFDGSFEAFSKLIHPEDWPGMQIAVERALEGSPYEVDFRIVRPDGKIRWLSTRGQVIRDEAGQPVRMLGGTIDITERREIESQLRESEERFRAAIEGGLDSFFILRSIRDENGSVTDFEFVDYNERGARLIGVPKHVGIGGRLLELLPANRDLGFFDKYVRVVETGEALEEEFGECAGGHTNLWLHQSVIKLGDGIAITTRDSTRRKQAEDEIRRLNASLEQRVRERTAALEEANREMEGFTYSVSHDLRSPLRAIVSSSMILLEDYCSDLRPEAQEQLVRQAKAAKRMADLIDDLLKLSRIGRQQIAQERIDLSALVIEIAHEIELREDRDIDLQVQPGLRVQGDERLLRLAIQNLVENAVKFAKPGPVRIQFGMRGGIFVFQDQGIGFEQQYADRIWRPFERLHRDEEYPGTGIGLANVKRIVERHGGRVWAEGDPGRGASFFFTL